MAEDKTASPHRSRAGYEFWVIWFRTFLILGWLTSAGIAVFNWRELLHLSNFLGWLALSGLFLMLEIVSPRVFRAARFVRIVSDYATFVSLSSAAGTASYTLDEFCAAVHAVPGGYTVTGKESWVFITHRHWSIGELLRACKSRVAVASNSA